MRFYQHTLAADSPIRDAASTTTKSTTRSATPSRFINLSSLSALRRMCGHLREGAALVGLVLVAQVLFTPVAHAQAIPITAGPNTPAGGARPFDITGAIESFTVNNIADAYSGGTIKVNGLSITIPRNLVITMPAAYLTTGQLFGGNASSGLALTDVPAPIAAYEASIAGNIVGNTYIAGLVGIAQQGLNGANGVIKSINYATGELCVGVSAGACNSTDARVFINDPSGRYGKPNGASGKPVMDTRFAVDSDNPTIHSASGYPMCIPRQTPPLIDQLCPTGNRPVGINTYVMSAAPLIVPAPFLGNPIPACGILGANTCNPNKQAPMKVGDYIGYSGILQKTSLGATYVAAYSIEVNVGIFTALGTTPYYIYMDAPLIGTGPALCPGNAECQARLRTGIFMTDPSRTPALYAIDENQAGDRTTRALPSSVVNTAQVGRFVFNIDKDARVMGLPGNGGVPREMIGMVAGVPDGTPVQYGDTAPAAKISANGLVFGQYVSPMGEYIFPEPNLSGEVLTPYNFRCLAFLANGWGQGGALANIGKLNPFPEAAAPASVNCSN